MHTDIGDIVELPFSDRHLHTLAAVAFPLDTSRPNFPPPSNIRELIEYLVSRSLRNHRLVPPFEETAKSLGRSERSLARAPFNLQVPFAFSM